MKAKVIKTRYLYATFEVFLTTSPSALSNRGSASVGEGAKESAKTKLIYMIISINDGYPSFI
jgi:hypothetical protein